MCEYPGKGIWGGRNLGFQVLAAATAAGPVGTQDLNWTFCLMSLSLEGGPTPTPSCLFLCHLPVFFLSPFPILSYFCSTFSYTLFSPLSWKNQEPQGQKVQG